MKKRCLYCGRLFIESRSDQKFCCLSCRNAYNNVLHAENRRLRNRVITDLNSNYDILYNLLKTGVDSILLTDICVMGFKPSFITGFCRTERNALEYSCFDIMYRMSDSKIYKIRQLPIF